MCSCLPPGPSDMNDMCAGVMIWLRPAWAQNWAWHEAAMTCGSHMRTCSALLAPPPLACVHIHACSAKCCDGLQALGMYKPVVWEYARLSITNNVMSKRKLNQLVTRGLVNGWDDPRLLTLAGLRRRGVTPQVHTSSRYATSINPCRPYHQ